MLHAFLVQHLDELVGRAKALAVERREDAASPALERGTSQLLALLLERLRETDPGAVTDAGMGALAAGHARALLELGRSVEDVVHDYGDVGQAITALASEGGAPIAPAELGALRRCLDDATAAAVAEYARLKDEAASHRELERLGQLGHDLRNDLQTALLSFHALKKGGRLVGGSVGDALGRSLVRLRDVLDARLTGVHLSAATRVPLAPLLRELAIAARADAEHRDIRLAIEPGDPALVVDADPRLLGSALMSLLKNAIQNTRPHGCVTLRARGESGRAYVEVEDECGGLGSSGADPRRLRSDRRGRARSRAGRGLSSSRLAAQANGGELRAHDLPGKGCVFGIQLPVAATSAT